MKKFPLSGVLMALSLLLSMAACSDDNEPAGKNDSDLVELTFDLDTRAKSRGNGEEGIFCDGSAATYLSYCLYRNGEPYIYYNDLVGPDDDEPMPVYADGQFKVKFNIEKDADYDIFLWANSFGWTSEFGTYDPDSKQIDFEDISLLPHIYNQADAFYAYGRIYDNTTKAINKTFTLKRPFCQINVVTDEFNDIDIEELTSRNEEFFTGLVFKKDEIPYQPNILNFHPDNSISVTFVENYPLELPMALSEIICEGNYDNTVTIDGREMRYLSSSYIPASSDGIIPVDTYLYAANGNTHADLTDAEHMIPIDLGTNLKPNSRIFIYPKAGTKLFPTEDEEVELIVTPNPSFSNKNNHEVN